MACQRHHGECQKRTTSIDHQEPVHSAAAKTVAQNTPIDFGFAQQPLHLDDETKNLIEKYDRAAPRYTSYPTAVQFTPEINARTQHDWLAAVPTEKPVSIYIHVPFCRTLCYYCGCHTKALGDNRSPIDHYLQALIQEVQTTAKALGRAQPVSQIHFGGGTPTILKTAGMAKLFVALRREFAVLDSAEISIEIDPRLVTKKDVQDMAALGFNRVSLGVQDFNEDVQRAIGRMQSYEETKRVSDWFRAAGVNEINFDMIYGLPLQTISSVLDNAQKVASLRPGRIALFGYAHVPWMKKNQIVLERYKMPDAPERFAQFEAVRAYWLAQGYKEIGIDHFALPEDEMYKAWENGTLHRNFMGYTTDRADTIIGLGTSSISAFPQGYAQNNPDTAAWLESANAGALTATRGVALATRDVPRREIIMRLMCYGRANCKETGVPPMMDGLAQDGLVMRQGDNIKITPKGRPFTRIVCTAFDEYLENKLRRHAKAV